MNISPKTAYLMKTHTCHSYKELSIAAKSFCVSLYTELQNWSEQDSKHLELLYNDAFADNNPDFAQPFPFTLEYDEDPSDSSACMKVIENIAEEMKNCEAITAQMFSNSEYGCFEQISAHRVKIASRLITNARTHTIFNTLSPEAWQCSCCGTTRILDSAPQSCSCCEAPFNAHIIFK